MTQSQPQSISEIRDWLVAYIATTLKISPETVQTDVELTSFGMNSAEAVLLCLDLGDWLGFMVDPSQLYRATTIQDLSVMIAGLQPRGASTQTA